MAMGKVAGLSEFSNSSDRCEQHVDSGTAYACRVLPPPKETCRDRSPSAGLRRARSRVRPASLSGRRGETSRRAEDYQLRARITCGSPSRNRCTGRSPSAAERQRLASVTVRWHHDGSHGDRANVDRSSNHGSGIGRRRVRDRGDRSAVDRLRVDGVNDRRDVDRARDNHWSCGVRDSDRNRCRVDRTNRDRSDVVVDRRIEEMICLCADAVISRPNIDHIIALSISNPSISNPRATSNCSSPIGTARRQVELAKSVYSANCAKPLKAGKNCRIATRPAFSMTCDCGGYGSACRDYLRVFTGTILSPLCSAVVIVVIRASILASSTTRHSFSCMGTVNIA